MFVAIPIHTPGEFEAAAIKRERDELWRNRYHLTPAQGKKLDILIGRIGHPEAPLNQINNPGGNPFARQGQWETTPADRQGFAPFEYEERS